VSSERIGRPAARTPPVEARVLRRTRARLALWSGATTLVVIAVLATLLYAVVARQLADDSERQLRARAESVASLGVPIGATLISDPDAITGISITDRSEAPGLIFGGPLSGTIAVIVDPDEPFAGPVINNSSLLDGADLIAAEVALPETLPFPSLPLIDSVGLGLASSGAEQLRVTTIDGTPVRVLSVPIEAEDGMLVVQVLSDMSAELRTLRSLVAVMLLGGLFVVVAAAMAGWVYSGRALVPVRDSLRRQREFAADASHELRTPLSVLRSNLEVIARHPPTAPVAAAALDDARDETTAMARLVDDLLLLARADAEAFPIEPRAMDLADEASEALEDLASRARSGGVGMILDVAPSPLTGDPARLRQLIAILVDNAIRYGHEGGHIWVTVRPQDQGATLQVADDGPGIASSDREHVFMRFWRGPDSGADGSGLGLAIAKWIVEAHEGTITVSDRDGGGARFEVYLPA
jgi:two-component system sensor histidine kinase CiaH